MYNADRLAYTAQRLKIHWHAWSQPVNDDIWDVFPHWLRYCLCDLFTNRQRPCAALRHSSTWRNESLPDDVGRTGDDGGPGVRGAGVGGAFVQKWAGARVRWAGGWGKKSEFWAGVPVEKIRENGAGVGRKKMGGVGGLNPVGKATPPVLPHDDTCILPSPKWQNLESRLGWICIALSRY